jgi:hypothetical protein
MPGQRRRTKIREAMALLFFIFSPLQGKNVAGRGKELMIVSAES